MLVKLNPEDDQVNRLKQATGSRTASKAYETAGAQYCEMLDTIERFSKDLDDLMLERDALLQIIADARNAAIALVERTGQADMFIEGK